MSYNDSYESKVTLAHFSDILGLTKEEGTVLFSLAQVTIFSDGTLSAIDVVRALQLAAGRFTEAGVAMNPPFCVNRKLCMLHWTKKQKLEFKYYVYASICEYAQSEYPAYMTQILDDLNRDSSILTHLPGLDAHDPFSRSRRLCSRVSMAITELKKEGKIHSMKDGSKKYLYPTDIK